MEYQTSLPPLAEGEQLLSEYYANCPECGQEVQYRWYITRRRVCKQIKTPCICTEKYRNENEKVVIKSQIQSLFGNRNLLEQKGYQRMRFKYYHPQNDNQVRALEYMQAWDASQGSVTLAGLPGRGKTHLAIAASFKAQNEGNTVLAIKLIDLLNILRRSYDKGSGQDVEIVDALKLVDVLLLDDVGAEKGSEWVQEKLYEIVDSRYGFKPTIFTTNLNSEALGKKLSPAIASRIYGAEKVLIIDGPDYRVKQDEWAGVGREVFR